MPGSVITSGRIWWSRSMRASTSRAVKNAISTTVRRLGPNQAASAAQPAPFAASTSG